jgi:hypothetical protein
MQLVCDCYSNGRFKSRGFYQNGELEGKREVWYENGQISNLEFYRGGKFEGERKTWYDNGQLANHDSYRDGEREGKHNSWNKNGSISGISYVKAGLAHGEYRYYWNDCPSSCYWCKDGRIIDGHFTFRKRRTWLRWKRMLAPRLMRDNQTPNPFLISDLTSLLET